MDDRLGSRSDPLEQLPARGDCFAPDCPTRAVLTHVTGRWGSLVIAALRTKPVLRFSQLRDRIGGVSEKMLAQTLRELERDGLIDRRSLPVVPPHVEYRLTPMGIGVAKHVERLVSWIETHLRELVNAQRIHDAVGAVGNTLPPQEEFDGSTNVPNL